MADQTNALTLLMDHGAASKAAYTASGGAIIAGLTLNEIGVMVGIASGVSTFLLNWYYQHRRDQREAALVRAAQETDEAGG